MDSGYIGNFPSVSFFSHVGEDGKEYIMVTKDDFKTLLKWFEIKGEK